METKAFVIAIFFILILQSLHARTYLSVENLVQTDGLTCPLTNYHETINELPLCGNLEDDWWNNSNNFTHANSGIAVKNYRLHFEFNQNLSQYCGRSKIIFKVVSCVGAQKIVFHSKSLQLLGISINVTKNKSDSNITANTKVSRIADNICTLDKERGVHLINFNNQLECRKFYMLEFSFKGITKQNSNGIQKISSYQKYLHKNAAAVMTSFHPNYAREAFPCFDDPSMKATFILNLVHSSKYYSYSNTPISIINTINDDKVIVYFEETPLMSTYLLAFSINNYSTISIQTNTTKKIEVRYIGTDSQIDRKKNMMAVVHKTIVIIESITNIPYPLTKLDLVDVSGVSYRSMENWGLIPFNLKNLHQVGVDKFKMIANDNNIIIHVITHQWFGNLVTQKSWSHVWLTEGLTSFFDFYISEKYFETKNNYIENLSFLYDMVMELDQSTQINPLVTPNMYHEKYPKLCFNLRTHFKGSIITRMLFEVVGEQKFIMFIRRYLREFAYKSVDTNDFINLLNKTFQNENINNMIQAWTFNPGFVIVFVSLLDVPQSTILQISYKRFIQAIQRKLENDELKWVVPIYYKVKYENHEKITTGILWLNQSICYFKLEGPISWIMINRNRIGFYVSSYNTTLWNKLIDTLTDDVNALSDTEKNTIIMDVIRSMQNFDISPTDCWKLMNYVKKERNMVLFKNIVKYMEEFAKLYEGSAFNYKDVYKDFFTRSYINMTISFKNNEIGLHLDDSLRNLIVEQCVKYQCSYVAESLIHTFNRLRNNKQIENITYMGFYRNVFLAVAMYGNVSELEMLKKREFFITNLKLLNILEMSMAHVQNPTILLRYLNDSLHGDFISVIWLQEFIKVSASTQTGRHVVWNFVKQNWKVIEQKFYGDPESLNNLLTDVSTTSKSPNIIQEVTELYKNNPHRLQWYLVKELIQLLKIKKINDAEYNP